MKPMNPKLKKGLHITGDILFWLFLALMIVITIFSFASKANDVGGFTKFGKTALFEIQSNSMECENNPHADGGFNKGDLIISTVLEGNEKSQCKVDDVVTFIADLNGDGINELNTHRIIDLQPTVDPDTVQYLTKGDNPLDTNPKWVVSGDVQAKWTGKKIPGLGAVMSFLKSPYGFWPCIVLPLVLLLGYEIVKLVLQIRQAKGLDGKNTRKITAAEEELIKQKAVEEYLKKQEAEKSASEQTKDK